MNEPTIIAVGNVAAAPTLRELPSGVRVCGFRVANTPRVVDKATGEWRDGATTWFGITAWRATADNCARSLKAGDRVVVVGRMSTRVWTSQEGEERSGLQVEALHVGYDLSRSAVQPVRLPPLTLTTDPGEQVCGPELEEEDEPVEEPVPVLA